MFIFEEPYLGSMYKKASYDQIYDEHIFIFSVTSIKKFLHYYCKLIDVFLKQHMVGQWDMWFQKIQIEKLKEFLNTCYGKEKYYTLKGCMTFKKNCEKSKKQLQLKISKLKNKTKK